MKRNIKNYLLILIEILIGGVCIIVDSFVPVKNDSLKGFLPVMYEMTVVVAGFWVTLYLLFLELFKDRYPFKFIEEKYLMALKRNVIYIAFCFVYGGISIVREEYFLESVFYILSSALTVIMIGKHVYDTSKTMMVTNYVKLYCDDLSKKFAENSSSINEVDLDDLDRVFEECIIKEEFSVAQKISSCSGEVFREFLKKSVEFIDSGSNREQVEKSFKRIAKFGKMQLERCGEIDSEILKTDIGRQQYLNIKFCIESNQFEYFKMYLKTILQLTSSAQRDHKDEIVEITFGIYTSILDDLLEEDKDEWIEFLLEEIYNITAANSHFFTSEYVKDFVRLISYGLIHGEDNRCYNFMFEKLKKITISLCNMSNGFDESIIYYNFMFNKLLESDNEYTERFIEIVFGEDSNFCHDSKWMEYKFYCLNRIKSIERFKTKTNEYLITLLLQVIEMKETYRGSLFLPDFIDRIYQCDNSKEKIELINDDFRRLFERCIISDNLGFFYMLIRKHGECLLKSTKEKKIYKKCYSQIIFGL